MKKVILKSMLLFVAILFVGIAQAQTVTGTVTEENGPLPGANVIVKGTSNGVTTDFDGNYSLNNVPSDATLVFSYVGFATQEVAVGGRSVVNVSLATDNALDEVVLIGYGSTTIKDATGSVDNVGSEDFNQGVIQSPEQLIQGKTAGVQISESSGEPGAGIAIRIRGNNSIRSGNDPLFVVDGVPLAGGGAPTVGVGAGVQGGATGGNPLSFINPNDIENISILKDASATAIYGSRGANGVIIIQTKAGRGASKGVWELTSSVSSAKPLNSFDLLNRQQFLDATDAIGATPLVEGSNTDWQDYITRNAFSRQTDLSYSKSYTGGNVRASFGYGNNNGVIENSSLERIAGRLNFSQRLLDDKLLITGQGSISRINRENPALDGTAGSTGDLIGAALRGNPTFPADPDFNPGGGVLNPASLLQYFEGRTNSRRILANLSADYSFTDEFSAKVTVGYDKTDAEGSAIYSSSIVGLPNTSGIGRGGFTETENKNSLLEATLNYKKDFGNSSLDLLAGYSYQEFDNSGYFSNAAGFGSQTLEQTRDALSRQFGLIDDVLDGGYAVFGYGADGTYLTRLTPEVQTGLELPTTFDRLVPAYTAGIFDTVDELQSYFVRANYTIADKYLFTGTFRADGSSRFGDNERYGYFPSGAFAWKISEEDFIGDNISTLKLRLGAGIVGSQEGLNFGQFLQIERAGGAGIDNNLNVLAGGVPGTFIDGAFTNPDLKWEETTDLNVGVDFGFNDDRLNGSVNLYRKETRDLLLNQAVAAPAGSGGTVFQNLSDGIVLNQGIEFSLNYDFFDTDDFGFGASFNIAYNKNEVQDTPLSIPTGAIRGNGLTGAFAQQLEAGQPLFSFFMAEFTGFDGDGNPTYTDFNGDGVGDPDSDKFFVGENAVPQVTSGLSLNARYKNFDLATYFIGQFGFSVYNATANAFFNKSALSIGGNVTQNVVTSNENPNATVAVSTRFLEKGDFIRMQTASLGYNWPLSGEGMFDSLRLSLTGQNLFLITDYSGLDPETSQNTGSLNASALPTAGIDYGSYPRARTFTLGVNATF
ncbi:TonB dependent/ligand-gated channel [Dokdonia sp. MED134]|uniref:SusC/RagA family TonB-linked outer membrane protein n=1 Tax=Dokdonia sp. MED134 TaxID=313590 RepID=UPI000068BFC5|nr:SusC/RagA family TonB-linked outer membrane protein [Dokdonia sp. MED134]EAQ38184.1 TonB dependent/ligand-gated channel [Dokdonia sp. MED134]